MSDMSRKIIGRGAQLLLLVLAVWYALHWVRSHIHAGQRSMHVTALTAPPDSLGPGDIRIYNQDSTIDLVLVGDRIATGLSPRMVAKIRAQMDSDTKKDSDSGLGASIASMVTKSVAGAIGTHAEFPLRDVRDVTYTDGRLNFIWKHGNSHSIFQTTNVNGKPVSQTFNEADARRFIDAVHARQQEEARH